MPKVSVIIPNYNRAEIVGDTVENMLRQSLQPYEVIVIDDGSTDDSIKVLQSFGDRITLVQQPNQGPGAARNVGLKRASGTFIQLMDSDDLASLNKLETQAKDLIKQNADIAYSPWTKAFITRKTIQLENTVLQQSALPSKYTPLEYYLTGWSVVLQQCLLRASFLKKVGLYRTDLWTCDDSDFFFRMLLQQPKICFSSDSLTLYRLDDYRKIPASGSTSLQRVEDWGNFLLSVLEQSEQHVSVRSVISHPTFRIQVWKTVQQLEKMGSTQQGLIQTLSEPAAKYRSNLSFKLRSRASDIFKGIQHRMQGHRWPTAYQPGKMTPNQHQLIQSMGFTSST